MDTRTLILEKLRSVADAGGRSDVVDRGRVEELTVEDGKVKLILNLPTDDRSEKFRVEDECRAAVQSVAGVSDVMVITRGAKTLEPTEQPRNESIGRRQEHPENPFDLQAPIPGVKNIVAVASGKGGVGKSTVCVNLALALSRKGAKVGLMDADIYGPSLGVLLGVRDRPKPGTDKEIAPVEQSGLKLMSLAFLTDPGTPVIWRGPLVMGVVKKFLQDVEWGLLDYLVIDLPPGTGDAQLTLVQTVPLTAAIIVTTPSELALVDAEKGLRMFLQLDVPVLGIVENMSGFICPHCGRKSDIFGDGDEEALGRRLSVPRLGDIPLDPSVRSSGDSGKPIVLSDENSPVARAFFDLADKVMADCPAVK